MSDVKKTDSKKKDLIKDNKNRSRSRSRSASKEKDKIEQNIPSDGKFPEDKTIKIIHWNVNGLRPLLKKDELDKLIKEENPDFICINETKIDYDVIKSMNLSKLFEDKNKFKSFR